MEERFHAETVTRREENAALFIPNDKRELPPQVFQTLRTQVFVQVERDFAVRARAEAVAPRLERRPDALVVVELAVVDDVQAPVLARDRLVALGVRDRKERVTQPRAPGWSDPDALSVGSAVAQRVGGAAQCLCGHRAVGGQDCGDSTQR